MGLNNFSFCILLIVACPEWVSAFYRLCPHKPYSGFMRTPPSHTNTSVGSAWPEFVTNSLPRKIWKSVDYRNRTYY